jgi:hypothetical protein
MNESLTSRKSTTQTGSVLLTLMIVLPFLALILGSYIALTASGIRLAKTDMLRTHAQLAVDAGIDMAMTEVNADEDWTGTGTEVELHNVGGVRTTYEVIVNTVDDEKELTALGRSYSPTSSTTPSSTVQIKVDLRPVKFGGFSIVTGVGGLIMNNNSKILGGDVFINGHVTLNNSAQIGLTTSPVNLNVAHQSCPSPPDATYPVICGSGENGEPIAINHNSHIFGDVKANNQVTTDGMSGPGLTASSGVTPLALPDYDRDAQKAAVASEITGTQASCSSGAKTWPADLKINGDVEVSGTCDITVEGNVWVTGSLEMRNTSELIASEALGTTMPVIMVDGNIARFTNSATLRANSSDTGFQLMTYRSDATCSPDCTDVTGIDLASSQTDLTIELLNSSSAPNSIFYAKWTRVSVGNSGQIGALVGQTVELSNTSTITFNSSVTVDDIIFWVIDGYRRVF